MADPMLHALQVAEIDLDVALPQLLPCNRTPRSVSRLGIGWFRGPHWERMKICLGMFQAFRTSACCRSQTPDTNLFGLRPPIETKG